MNKDLNVGDRVIMDENNRIYPIDNTNPSFVKGIIIPNPLEDWIHVKWDNGVINGYHPDHKDLKLVLRVNN